MPWNIPFGSITVAQGGGYIPLTIEREEDSDTGESTMCKLLVFVKKGDIDKLRFENKNNIALKNVYQAINSNSRYAFVLEFFVEPTEIDNLEAAVTAKLDNRTDYGMYKEILVVGPESP